MKLYHTTQEVTKDQFHEVRMKLRQAGWVYAYDIKDGGDGRYDHRFGSCYMKDGVTRYVNRFTAVAIDVMLRVPA